MKGVHAYMELTDLPYCVFCNCSKVVSSFRIYQPIYSKHNIIQSFRADQLLNKSDTRGAGAALLAPPDIPLNSLRRTSEGSLPWGTSVSAESGSDEELEDSTAAEDGAVGTGNGTATDGASDANGERRGSIVKDITDKKKKGEKRRRKPDKQGNFY